MIMQALIVIVLACFVQLFLVREAFAYLDAGTGSFIFQAIVAAVVGLAVTLRHYWSRIKAKFRRGSAEEDAEPKKAAVGND